ncbi:MAG: family 10 glycosylhydrolase, partial [Fusobacteriaceae bacterium]
MKKSLKLSMISTMFLLSTLASAAQKELYQFESIDETGKITYSVEKKATMNAKEDGTVVMVPENYETSKNMMRTTWVASVENLHFPKKVNGVIRNSMEELKIDWIEILDKHEELNFNTVIFQVSPTLDALYKSKYRPWSHVLSGVQGQA